MNKQGFRMVYGWPWLGAAGLMLGAVPVSAQPREGPPPPREGPPPPREGPPLPREGPSPREEPPPRSDSRGSEPIPSYDDRTDEDYDDIDYDSEPPYDYTERIWRREARDFARSRDRWDRRERDGRWRSYRPGWRYYEDGGYDDYDYYGHRDRAFDEGYWEGRRDGRRFAEWERRNQMGRRSYKEAMSEGLDAFRNGDYSEAVLHFIRAAKLNQGDPASRIHAAHALVAIGRYAEALPALRRAFQLQPKIAYLAMDIRRDYGNAEDFETHWAELEQATREADDDPALWLLLGYYQFYSGRVGEALRSLARSDELAPGDFLTEALLESAQHAAPAPKSPAQEKRRSKVGSAPEGKNAGRGREAPPPPPVRPAPPPPPPPLPREREPKHDI